MKFPPFAKAVAGSVVGALASAGTTAATTGTLDTSSGVAAVLSAVAGFVLPYFVPNGNAAAKGGASGLVVTLKTDAEAFLAAFGAGLPTLVETAAKAALEPAPKADVVPVAVVDAGAGEGVAPVDPTHPVAQP